MIVKSDDHGPDLLFWVELRGFEPLTPSMRTVVWHVHMRAWRMTIAWSPGTFGTSMPQAAGPIVVCREQVARFCRRIHLTGAL